MKRMLILSIFALLIASCTTLPAEHINKLKNCDTPLESVRRTLLKRGFALKADEPDFINTEFHTTNFGFEYPMAFLVEKTSPTSVRITTSVRSDSGEHKAVFISTNEDYHKQIHTVLCIRPKTE